VDEQGYWYGIEGERHGPVSFAELRRLVEEGRLRPVDSVWNEQDQVWTRVSEFPGLLDDAAPGIVGDPGHGRVHEPAPAWEDAAPEEQPVEYAGFWMRAGAFLIDQLVLGMIGFAWGMVAAASGLLDSWLALEQVDPQHMTLDRLLESIPWSYYAVSTAISWIYYAGQEASRFQATLGKRAMGLVVADAHGNRCGFGTTTLRFLVKSFVSPIFLVGFLIVLFTEHRQALHDLVAGTFVEKL
jgi:uncharacterized RDD family membrane protein YckC